MRKRAAPRLSIPVVLLTGVLLFGSVFRLTGCNPQPLPVAPTRIPALPAATLPVEVAVEAALHSEDATAEPASDDSDARSAEAGVDLNLGKQVFETRCAICHSLSSDPLVGPGLSGMFNKVALPNGNSVDDEGLREWISNGGGSMPGVPLGDEDLLSLIGFLKDATG